jgi:hypothetical protein
VVKIHVAIFWVMTYCLVGTEHEMFQGCGVFGTARGTAFYRQDNWTAVGRSKRLIKLHTD